MAKQTINIGASPNDGTGTPLRTAFDYTNQNFTELYTATGPSGNNIVVPGSATITGDLTVDTSTLKVDSTNNRVTVGTTSAYGRLTVGVGSGLQAGTTTNVASGLYDIDYATTGDINTRFSFVNSNGVTNAAIDRIGNPNFNDNGNLAFLTRLGAGSLTERYRIASDGVATWSNVGGVAGTAMTLNSTGLGVGVSPFYKFQSVGIAAATDASFNGSGGNLIGALLNSDVAGSGANPGVDLRRWTGTAFNHGTSYIATNSAGDTLFYNGAVASNTRATSLKMTLDASGNLLVGSALPVSGGRISGNSSSGPAGRFFSSAGDNQFAAMFDKSSATNTTSQWLIGFTINNQSTGSGQINANGASQAAFGTFSDSRLKENILSLPSQLANILSLRPVEFDYKDGSGHQIGFVAQEMQEVYSDAVGEQNGFLTVTGWSKTEARLVSAIKELAAKVQALEAKLA